jgi:hypothetical protein
MLKRVSLPNVLGRHFITHIIVWVTVIRKGMAFRLGSLHREKDI